MTVCLLAVNLRLGITAASALIDPLTRDGTLGSLAATLVTSIPVVVFALAGFTLNPIIRRWGRNSVMTSALVFLVVGLSIRGVPEAWMIIGGTIVASAGMAVLNVELPALIREWFPSSTSRVSTIYTTFMALGAAVAAVVTVPIAETFGRSEAGLGFWALPAVLALIAWIVVATRTSATSAVKARSSQAVRSTQGKDSRDSDGPVPADRISGKSNSWPVGTGLLAGYFALQTLTSYVVIGWLPTMVVASGIDAARAGALLGIVMGVGIPATLIIVPGSATHRGRIIGISLTAVSGSVGSAGLIALPTLSPELWAVMIGIGLSGFPVALALMSRIGTDSAEVGRVSRLTQGIGYSLGALGPVGAGALHHLCGSWHPVFGVLACCALAQGLIGIRLSMAIKS